MPQQPENNLKPEVIINIILKRRWLIIVPFCLAIVVGIYLSLTLPKKYESSTLIMVEAPKVSDSYVQSLVTEDISSRLTTIEQQVKSRTNIERIIETYHLFEGPEYEKMFLEDKVDIVRNRIHLDDTKKSRSNELSTFSISYQGEEPNRVKNVANALAAYIIDENTKIRQSQAESTSGLLDDELESTKQQLEKSEQELREYQQKYMWELPDQSDANQSGLERSRAELLDQQQALRETNNALAALEQQIAESQQNAAPNFGEGEEGEATDLATLQAQLDASRVRGYSENHPTVIRLRNMISKLEAQTENIENESVDSESADNKTVKSRLTAAQENQLTTLKLQKQNIEAEIEDLKKEAEEYQRRVNNTPKRQTELIDIERNYDLLKSHYDSLYERRLEAKMSLNVEKKQQGEQFRIIDFAVLPEKPVSPDMKKLFLLTIAAGLGLGGGLVFLLEFMNKSFKSSDEAESFLGLPVLATIPSLQHPKDRVLSRINNILSIASVLFSFLLLAGFAVITLKGTDATIEFAKQFL